MSKGFILNLNEVPKELKLMIELIKSESIEELNAIEIGFFENLDCKKFVELAFHHRIFPVISQKVKKIYPNKLLTKFVVDHLNSSYKNNIFNMLHLSAEMEQVSMLFKENQIKTLFLKGPVLAAELYGDISLRTSGDLDLMIPISDLDKAEKLLLDAGYVKDDYIETILNDWKWRHHHITFIHPQKNIKLEIHWRLNPGPSKEPSFEELWDRKQLSKLTSNPVYFLGREDLFLFLVSHGARHGWSRLRWLLDIHQLVKFELNWPYVIKLLKKHQYLHIGGQALILSSQLFNTPLSKEMVPLIKNPRAQKLSNEATFYLQKMVNLHTDPVPEDVARYHKRHLFSLMSFRQKILFLISLLFPYPEDAKTLPLPEKLHLLYFPLRPFLWVLRKTKKSYI